MSTDWALLSNGGQIGYGQNRAVGSPSPYTQPIDGDDGTLNQYAVMWANLPTVTIYLTQARTIFGWRVLFSGIAYAATTAEVWYSLDNITYTQIYSGVVSGLDWQYACTPTLGRFWKFVFPTGGASFPRFCTVSVFEDEYQSPAPPVGQLESDLYYKIGSRGPEIAADWLLLQAAPANFDPLMMLAVIGLWNNWLLNEIYANGGGGTVECPNTDPNNQAVFNRIVAAETQIGQDIDDLQTIMNQQYLVVAGDADHSLSDLYHRLESAENYIYQAVQNLEGLIKGLSGIDLTHLHDDLQSGISAIAANDNANTAAIRGDPVTDLRSLTTTMTTSFSTQTGELRGPLGTTHDAIAAAVGGVQSDVDDILEALATLPSTSGSGPVVYPGSATVQWGTPVEVQGEAIVSALTYGVNGRMDGVAVLMLSGSPRVTDRQAAGVLNYRYAGFMAFGDDYDHWDEPQYLNLDHRIYVGKGMRDPKLCLIAGSPGVTMQVTPWVIANP